jgi:hypothetical protein
MGLDMYMQGEIHLPFDTVKKLDGFKVDKLVLEIGYWRKHPNLHGYIVKEFAGGVDECQRIDLSREQLVQLLKAVKEDKLPPTEGFFFGESDGSEKEGDIQVIEQAIAWLDGEKKTKGQRKGEYRSVVYKASW